MGIGFWIALVVIALLVVWRINIRRQGRWVELPSDPQAFVKPELVQIVEWLAKEAETQIGRGHDVSGNPIALSAIGEAVETALTERQGDGQVEIALPEFIHDAEGAHGFRVTIDQEQLTQFNL
jgi:hypothetical protein